MTPSESTADRTHPVLGINTRLCHTLTRTVQQCCRRGHLGDWSPVSCLQEVIHSLPFVCLVSVWQSEPTEPACFLFFFLVLSASSYRGVVVFRAPASASQVTRLSGRLFSLPLDCGCLVLTVCRLHQILGIVLVYKLKMKYQINPVTCCHHLRSTLISQRHTLNCIW